VKPCLTLEVFNKLSTLGKLVSCHVDKNLQPLRVSKTNILILLTVMSDLDLACYIYININY